MSILNDVAAIYAGSNGDATKAPTLGLTWGWGHDPKQEFHRDVLYVDLPTGQVSFHTAGRGAGPTYPNEWDGQRGQGATRIFRWVADLLEGRL